jgi:regulatory protein
MARGPRPSGKTTEPAAAPTSAALHEAALAYLARTSATAATLKRALERKVSTWARRAARAGADAESVEADTARCREAIAAVLARFREVGLVNDAAFAEARTKSLQRSGRSRRAIEAHLAAKGVSQATAREVVSIDAEAELGAALAFARKRRLGPFADEPVPRGDRAGQQKAVAAMARAGFGWSVCERALNMDREQADERLENHRRSL